MSRGRSPRAPAAVAGLAGLAAGPAHAAAFGGAGLPPAWGLPFAGLLLSIALLPLAAPAFWHRHFGKVVAGWAALFLVPFAAIFGPGEAVAQLAHALVAEYLPFILLLTALFTVAGGIHVRGNLHGSPGLNTGLLALGAALASVMGTTGAAMLLLRPLLRANDDRPRRTHVVVFFIFLVCNVGGALTPLGDPPLFLGFLKGVSFSWTLRHILPHTLFVAGLLLAAFYLLDRWHFRREGRLRRDPTPDTGRIGIDGGANVVLLGGIVGLVLMSGLWKSPVAIDILGTAVGLPGLVRDLGLAAIALLSLRITPRGVHAANRFGWGPMAEVAKLFAGIFLTIAPVIAMLRAGADGSFGAVIAAVTRLDGRPDPAMYFWATGVLSAFLDNAPTYLVFFHTAGGDPAALMGPLAPTLAAISAGAVFMGAITYIGNAPNLMVKAIAEERGVPMPGFFGYMAWSCAILAPLFLAVTAIWFR